MGLENKEIRRVPVELPGMTFYFGVILHCEEQTEQAEECERMLYIM